MNQDEIIEMARQAGLMDRVRPNCLSSPKTEAAFEAFAKLVAAKEREACIELIKSHGPTLVNGFMLAEAIRARGEA